MKKRHILFLCLAVAAMVGSCVYDFNPQIAGEGGFLIVDGNIVIGEVSQVRLSYSWSLADTLATKDEARMAILYRSKMHVEDDKGGRYENKGTAAEYGFTTSAGGAYAYFDMREADPSLQYRLVVENSLGTYVSAWAPVLSPGQIDSLSFVISQDQSLMGICVSTHSDGSEPSYYRWQVYETWEYHAETPAYYKYLYTGDEDGEVVPLPDSESTYRCWLSGYRPEIMTASTEDLSEDRLVNHQLYAINNRDERVSVIYKPEVLQMRIPEEAYRYWVQMDRNEQDVGGLFSPEPSELRGNVTNLDHPEELVLGYVGVMGVARAEMYVVDVWTRFFRRTYKPTPALDTLRTPAEYLEAYNNGRRPVMDVFNDVGFWIGYEWWPSNCLDCRLKGGTTRRPPEWPN